jgi:hypothetical protein
MSNDGEEFFTEEEPRAKDFRRANGAPMVRKLDDPAHWDRYSRPSAWGDDLDDESALTLWKIDRACDGVAASPALAAQIAAIHGRTQGRTELREKAIQLGRGEEAADLGTALHALAHRFETEEGFPVPEPHASDIACYVAALDEAGLESTHFECTICADQWRAAGTADRIYRATRSLALPDGSRLEPEQSVVGDLKTGKKLTYNVPGFCIQMAIYADGVFYDIDTDERSPMPDGLRLDWGLLVHLPAGAARCTFHWVDLEIGRLGARIVQQVRSWRKRDDFLAEFAFPVSDEVAVLSSPIYDLEHEISDEGKWSSDDTTETWRLAMMPWVQARVNIIGTHPEARAMLLRRWPRDIPPIRGGELTSPQLARALNLLDSIESAYGLPFPEGDPRVEWSTGLHRSKVERGNEPRSNVQ